MDEKVLQKSNLLLFMLARNYDIKFNINEKNFFMLARKKKRKGISVGRLMRNYYKKP